MVRVRCEWCGVYVHATECPVSLKGQPCPICPRCERVRESEGVCRPVPYVERTGWHPLSTSPSRFGSPGDRGRPVVVVPVPDGADGGPVVRVRRRGCRGGRGRSRRARLGRAV